MLAKIPCVQISAASLLMHPLMVEILPFELNWRANTTIPRHERYTIGMIRARNQIPGRMHIRDYERISDSVNGWLARQGVSVCETRRALLDIKTKRYWSVDFICELEGRCCLVCLFHGGRQAFTKHEMQYAERLMRLAKQTYLADVRVVAVKVWGRDAQTSTWEIGSERESMPIH